MHPLRLRPARLAEIARKNRQDCVFAPICLPRLPADTAAAPTATTPSTKITR